MLVSSAKSKGCVNLEALGRSLMYSMKNKGPKMEPWGTPHFKKPLFFGKSLRQM